MALRLIGAGFGRTGTLSVCTALNELGWPSYHMTEVWKTQNREHLGFWQHVANTPPGTPHDWSRVFGNYAATVDNPGCCVWRELVQAHPEAKVLLTVHPRGPDAWYDSTLETIYAADRMWQFRLLARIVPRSRRYADVARKLIWGRSLQGTMGDRGKAIERYLAHVEEVKAAVPSERLLVYSAAEGWEPLCRFLGVPVPDTPFPNVNDRAQIAREIGDVARRVDVTLAAGAVVFAVAAYELARVLL